jgi:hypothetical protein
VLPFRGGSLQSSGANRKRGDNRALVSLLFAAEKLSRGFALYEVRVFAANSITDYDRQLAAQRSPNDCCDGEASDLVVGTSSGFVWRLGQAGSTVDGVPHVQWEIISRRFDCGAR